MKLELECRSCENDKVVFGYVSFGCMDIDVHELGVKSQCMIKKEEAIKIIEHLKEQFEL